MTKLSFSKEGNNEKYFIAQKIEKVKELLKYDQLSLPKLHINQGIVV